MKKKSGKNSRWKDITPHDSSSFLIGNDEGGFVSLEEIDETLAFGLEAPAQEDNKNAAPTAKSKKKRASSTSEGPIPEPDDEENENAAKSSKKSKNKRALDKTEEKLPEPDDEDISLEDVTDWNELRIHVLLLKAIAKLGFKSPTPIQKACIPVAAHKGKDLIGAAETGSGKTLAFGIPILQRLLDERDKLENSIDNELSDGLLRALIITPTRELALQICDHLRAVAKYTDIAVVPIVGGMSVQKQERILKHRPPIVVGTPGRLWELMSNGQSHLLQLEYLSFFILDEADRMVEKGHFHELQSIIDMLPVAGNRNKDDGARTAKKKRQTLVFSATLTLPSDFKQKLKKGFGKTSQHSVALLSEKAGIHENAEVVDLTSKGVVAHKLTEAAIECSEEEKDACLYYLLKVHGCGRTIVFCTSIAALRRLSAILQHLDIPAWPLHAQLQQRQRLKTMDRFRSTANGVLVATDLAARGLDIPGVRTVIHYQLPHSAEMYVHRSGRTARADTDGCSVALISPTENSKYISLCRALSKTDGLTTFPLDLAHLPPIQKRIALALQIDKISREQSQTKAKKSWLEQHAKALEIDLDEDEDNSGGTGNAKKNKFKLKALQEELKHLLNQPLDGFSRRYVAGAGLTPLAAQQLKEIVSSKQQKRKGSVVVVGQEEVEPLQALKKHKHGK